MPGPLATFSVAGLCGLASACGCPAFGITCWPPAFAEAVGPSCLGASSSAETRAADALPEQIGGCAGQGKTFAEARGGYEASQCMMTCLLEGVKRSRFLGEG